MSGRVNEAILQNTSWSVGRQAPMLDLKYGGQMGFSANLSQWVSNQSYVRRNLFCLLLEAPRGFSLMPGGDILVSILRSLVELHPLSIDGLNATVEVDAQETAPVGGAGEQHQDFMNVTRQRSNPVFRWTEKYGMPINAFLETWITYLLQDPESKVANIATLDITPPSDMLADMYSATMIFIETDPTHKKVVKAWIGTNMWPTSAGEVLGRREITAPGEAVTYDITFTGIFQTGAGVRTFAQSLLDGISITGANPQNRPSFVEAIAADVAAVTEGYSQGISTLSNSSIKA